MNAKIDPLEQYVIDFVRRLRVENKLKQRDIAAIIDTSPSFVGNIENNNYPAKYNLKHINILADYFNISPTSFLPDKPIKYEHTVADI
ncbi:MAG TPA: helix-turn-helix transcriptional regulator [Pedobacter sp.]